MAKGKKSSGKHYTSKGEIGVNRKISNSLRRERGEADNMLNKFNAYLKGKTAYVTIDNPNTKETNKRRIRVSLRTIHGDPKEYLYGKKDTKKA